MCMCAVARESVLNWLHELTQRSWLTFTIYESNIPCHYGTLKTKTKKKNTTLNSELYANIVTIIEIICLK